MVGVILNRVASAAHGEMLSRACFEHVSTPVLGMIPRDAALALPSRHLGLVQAAEHPDLAAFMAGRGRTGRGQGRARPAAAAGAPAQRVDPGPRHAALAAARPAHRRGARPRLRLRLRGRAGRLATAGSRAAACSRRWRTRRRTRPPTRSICPAAIRSCTPACWPATGGSSPACARPPSRGAFVYGECGGYMTLGRTLIDRSGQGHAMAGLLPVVTSFAEPTLHLGYRQIDLLAAGPLGARRRRLARPRVPLCARGDARGAGPVPRPLRPRPR